MQIHPAISTDRLNTRERMRKTTAGATSMTSLACASARGTEGGAVCAKQGVDVHGPICALRRDVFV